jgi:hypothetical protein
MFFIKKFGLVVACSVAVFACDDQLNSQSDKQQPLALPDVGLYQAHLLRSKNDKAIPTVINEYEGLALIYPESQDSQRWGVWAESDEPINAMETLTQWTGYTYKENESKKTSQQKNNPNYHVILDRISERNNMVNAGSSTYSKITFKDKLIINSEGKEIKSWVFDFTRTGTKFHDGTDLYPKWNGYVALKKLATKKITTNSWDASDEGGFANQFVGKIDTTNNSGNLTIYIEFPAAGCTLEGRGVQRENNILSMLTVTGFGRCNFKLDSDLSQIENKWSQSLRFAKDGVIAYATVFTHEKSKQDELVIGFPETNGLILTADKLL